MRTVAGVGLRAVHSVFQRDTGTGLLTFVEAKVDGVGGVSGLGGAAAVVVSPDQRSVYVGGTSASSLAIFARNLPGGTLTFVESSSRGGATTTMGLAVSFDSEHVYQAYGLTHPDVRLFQRRNTLRAFDTDTASLRPGLNVPSGLADAAGAFAVYVNPDDLHPYLYDAATDTVTEIGGGSTGPVRRIALSENLIAMTVIQPSGFVPPFTTLAVVPTSAPASAPVMAGTFASDIDVTDLCSAGSNANQPCRVDGDCPGGTCTGVVVMLTEEYLAGMLNDDDDDADAVVQVYRSATSALYSTKFQAEEFVLGGNLVAMRSNEFRQATKLSGDGTQSGGVDLNGDGDIGHLETVMEVYDLLTDTRVNSGLAAVPCDLPGCEAGHPYKIKGATVAFLTREADQGGQDLDGDGSSDDTVVEIFNPRTLRAQFFPMPAGAPNLPPLPDEFVGSTIVYQEVNEADVDHDVTGDGDKLDLVTLVEGDNDEDGTFNQQDTCVETANASQRDIDLDGLGDACDPNPSCGDFVPGNPVTPPWTVTCQEKLGKAARSYLNARNGAVIACLDRVTAGKLPGSAVTSRCRGGTVGDVALLPSDDKTGAKIAKADASLAKKVASCDSLDLADLNACADGSHDVAACVSARHAEAVSLTSDMAYGEVVPTSDKAVVKCQKALGKASRAYLKATMAAMQGCLDRRNAGEIAGNGQVMCLGSSTNSGVQLPTDPDANASFVKARAKLIGTITTACPGGLLGSLDACGADPASAVSCLECTHWRRAIAATRSVYGG